MGILNDPSGKNGRDLKNIGLLTAVPGIMLFAPLIGYGIGWWLDKQFGTGPYLGVVGILLGLGSAGVETYPTLEMEQKTSIVHSSRPTGHFRTDIVHCATLSLLRARDKIFHNAGSAARQGGRGSH